MTQVSLASGVFLERCATLETFTRVGDHAALATLETRGITFPARKRVEAGALGVRLKINRGGELTGFFAMFNCEKNDAASCGAAPAKGKEPTMRRAQLLEFPILEDDDPVFDPPPSWLSPLPRSFRDLDDDELGLRALMEEPERVRARRLRRSFPKLRKHSKRRAKRLHAFH